MIWLFLLCIAAVTEYIYSPRLDFVKETGLLLHINDKNNRRKCIVLIKF